MTDFLQELTNRCWDGFMRKWYEDWKAKVEPTLDKELADWTWYHRKEEDMDNTDLCVCGHERGKHYGEQGCFGDGDNNGWCDCMMFTHGYNVEYDATKLQTRRKEITVDLPPEFEIPVRWGRITRKEEEMKCGECGSEKKPEKPVPMVIHKVENGFIVSPYDNLRVSHNTHVATSVHALQELMAKLYVEKE